VDRIDVAVEAIRRPSEIGRMLDEAQGKVGALTEVLGGSCVVGEPVPGEVRLYWVRWRRPDPNKRYQVEAKRKWALEHAAWATTEGLRAEERQLRILVQDCDLMLEEMDLIEKAKRNADQSVVIGDEGPTA
jgi:hypothetical protein